MFNERNVVNGFKKFMPSSGEMKVLDKNKQKKKYKRMNEEQMYQKVLEDSKKKVMGAE